MRRGGVAELPLHSGRAPRWLFEKMVELAEKMTEIIVMEYGEIEFLRRISDPFWFQAFSCVLGFDWHSSGTTTTTTGALKVALKPEKFGIAVCGGKGRAALRTPEEIRKIPFDIDHEELVRVSRMSAKIDNSCVQDGYSLYHHTIFISHEGDWAVVQQGMNECYARRYHWLSERIESFVKTPHSGISADRIEEMVLDITSDENEPVRKASVDAIREFPSFLKEIKKLRMPKNHILREFELRESSRRILEKLYELQPSSYEELVEFRGVGPKTIRALALISSLIYGEEISWRDPARYSYAHGGKDGTPYPVDKRNMKRSIEILRRAIEESKAGKKDKMRALRRLSEFTLRLEHD
ncbi:MAG: DUF763 domain-containing protein [Archaeoglobi archaeon]|nr:DUF763 domain-containing protein [Candidatus Mnemosynella sp.]